MKRKVAVIGGTMLLVVGTFSMVTPIPGGMVLLSFGAVLLICASPWFRKCVQFFRTRLPWFNHLMTWMEDRMGQRVGGMLKLTQPGYEPKPGDHGT